MVSKGIFLDNLTIEVERQVTLIHNEYNKFSTLMKDITNPEVREALNNFRAVMKNSIMPIQKAAILAATAGIPDVEIDKALEPYNACLDVMSENIDSIYNTIYLQSDKGGNHND